MAEDRRRAPRDPPQFSGAGAQALGLDGCALYSASSGYYPLVRPHWLPFESSSRVCAVKRLLPLEISLVKPYDLLHEKNRTARVKRK